MELIPNNPNNSSPDQLPQIVSVRSLVDIRATVPRYKDMAPTIRRAWLTTQVLYCNALNHQKPETDMLRVDVAALDTALASSAVLADLTQPEISFAMFHGTMGEYGDYYGLTAKTFAGFCREFLKTDVKYTATHEERKAAEPDRGSWVLERMEYQRRQVQAQWDAQQEQEELDDRLEGWKKQLETIKPQQTPTNDEHQK